MLWHSTVSYNIQELTLSFCFRLTYICIKCGVHYAFLANAANCGCDQEDAQCAPTQEDAQCAPTQGEPTQCSQPQPLGERNGQVSWTHGATLLLITACGDNVLEKTSSKNDLRERWIKVAEIMASHKHALSWETCRAKWHRLMNKYKQVKDQQNKSGSGRVRWEFFDVMDGLLAKDPAIVPQHALTSTPLSKAPQLVSGVGSTGKPAALASPRTPGEESASVSAATPTGAPGRKRRRPVPTSSSSSQTLEEIRSLIQKEGENRERYRARKLAILEQLAKSMATTSK